MWRETHLRDEPRPLVLRQPAHMNSAPVVSVGQTVEKGKVLGYVGSTGNSTGNHLHLEMKVNNVLVNVMNYLS